MKTNTIEPPKPVARADINRAVEAILAITGDYCGHTKAQLLGRNRQEPLATDRQIAMALARELTTASSIILAQLFNRGDHSTILWAAKIVGEKAETDVRVLTAYERIKQQAVEKLNLAPV